MLDKITKKIVEVPRNLLYSHYIPTSLVVSRSSPYWKPDGDDLLTTEAGWRKRPYKFYKRKKLMEIGNH